MKVVGFLEMWTGGMFADKSTNLQRQAKRHMMAGRKVVMLKPAIDNRYGDDVVVTHDGHKMPAIQVAFDDFSGVMVNITLNRAVIEADVVCIDEVQFFPQVVIAYIEDLIYSGKIVYVSGLDMDKTGKPFEVTMLLMGRAEEVHKVHAVCRDCGEDAWLSVETVKQEGRVNIGNDYKPVCRGCSVKYLKGDVTH